MEHLTFHGSPTPLVRHLNGIHTDLMSSQSRLLVQEEEEDTDQKAEEVKPQIVGSPPPQPIERFFCMKPYDKNSEQYKRRLIALCMFIAKDFHPLNVSQGEGFREFVKVLDPRFPLPMRQDLELALYQLYNEKRGKLYSMLNQVPYKLL